MTWTLTYAGSGPLHVPFRRQFSTPIEVETWLLAKLLKWVQKWEKFKVGDNGSNPFFTHFRTPFWTLTKPIFNPR